MIVSSPNRMLNELLVLYCNFHKGKTFFIVSIKLQILCTYPLQTYHPDRRAARFKVSENYRWQFEKKRDELATLVNKVEENLKTNEISLDDLKSLFNRHHKLWNDIRSTTSLEEAVNIIFNHTSLINTHYLLKIAKTFKLQAAIDLINQYNSSIDEFCKEIPTQHAYGQMFMTHSHLYQSETVEFVLEWDDDDKTLNDIQCLLRKAFCDYSEYVMVTTLSSGNSVIVICYAPPHLHGELKTLVNANEAELRKDKVLSITIGGDIILKREPEIKVRMSVLINEFTLILIIV